VDYEVGACSSNESTVAGFATSTTWNSVTSRSGVASTRTSLTEQFDSGAFDYARVSVQTAATLSTNCNWCFVYELLMRLFHIGNFCFWVLFLKQLLLKNCAVDFVEICKVYVGKMIIKAAKRIFNSDKIWRSYSDLGVTFLEHSVYSWKYKKATSDKRKQSIVNTVISCPCSSSLYHDSHSHGRL